MQASILDFTGKSLSEALTFASTNPQYDDRLFIFYEVSIGMKIASSVLRICVHKLFWMSKQKQQFVYTTRSADILSLQFSWAMNNLSSYCGLVDAKIRASDKDLPVPALKK